MSTFILQALFLAGFPLLLVAGSAYFTWGALARPWAYVMVSLLTLYAAYVAVFYLFAPKSVGYMISAVQPGEPPGGEPFLMLLKQYSKPLLIFPLVALPLIGLLLRYFKR